MFKFVLTVWNRPRLLRLLAVDAALPSEPPDAWLDALLVLLDDVDQDLDLRLYLFA